MCTRHDPFALHAPGQAEPTGWVCRRCGSRLDPPVLMPVPTVPVAACPECGSHATLHTTAMPGAAVVICDDPDCRHEGVAYSDGAPQHNQAAAVLHWTIEAETYHQMPSDTIRRLAAQAPREIVCTLKVDTQPIAVALRAMADRLDPPEAA